MEQGQLLSQEEVLGHQRRPRACGEGNQSDQVDGNQRQRPQAVHNGGEAHGTRGSPRIARYETSTALRALGRDFCGPQYVWPDVGLFELQLKLRQSGLVSSWLYEPEIRADNELTNFGYAKDYDAIVTFRNGNVSGKVALEYERFPKSTRQYWRIADTLNRETKVAAVLYLVCNVQMESFLLNGLRGTRHPVYVCQAQQFADHPTEAMLVGVARQTQHRLVDCLT